MNSHFEITPLLFANAKLKAKARTQEKRKRENEIADCLLKSNEKRQMQKSEPLPEPKLAPAKKLILSPEIKQTIDEIVTPLLHPEQWEKLNLSFAPHPHAVILFTGEPGTGKTALANHIARRFKKAPKQVNFAGVASHELGKTEEKIREAFQDAPSVVIMEECDALLWSRDMVQSEDNIHVLGFINTLLTEIDQFIQRETPSLLILTTNYPRLLDAALLSRITDTINLAAPKGIQAERMWADKLPQIIKDTMIETQWISLQTLGLTPREMEKRILQVCRKALLKDRQPVFSDFQF